MKLNMGPKTEGLFPTTITGVVPSRFQFSVEMAEGALDLRFRRCCRSTAL